MTVKDLIGNRVRIGDVIISAAGGSRGGANMCVGLVEKIKLYKKTNRP